MSKFIIDSMKVSTLDELVTDLVNEIKRDTKENASDENIVTNNMNLLEKVLKNTWNKKLIIDELELFGAYVTDISHVKFLLHDILCYYNNNNVVGTYENEIKNLEKVITDIETNLENLE